MNRIYIYGMFCGILRIFRECEEGRIEKSFARITGLAE